MATINKINVGGTNYDVKGSLLYGVCETAASTAVKEVTVDGTFTLYTGATVIVKFTQANSVAENNDDTLAAQLNVNGTGAKPIKRYGTTDVSSGTTTNGWIAGAVLLFVYDGTNWIETYWNNTTYSNASLGQGYAACSTAAGTAAKTASISSYALTTGGIVVIKFNNGITVANPTLNISSKGAKKIFYKGSALTDTTLVKANDTVSMIYDGTQYQMFSIEKDTNTDTQVGQNKLSGGTVEAKILLTAPGTTSTTTSQAYFHEGFGYNGATDTITANSSGVICTNEDSGFTTKLDEHGLRFGYDTINYTSSFRINEQGSPSGESDGVKQDWRNYLDIYVQDTEPDDSAPVGAIWIDTSVSSITYAEGVAF